MKFNHLQLNVWCLIFTPFALNNFVSVLYVKVGQTSNLKVWARGGTLQPCRCKCCSLYAGETFGQTTVKKILHPLLATSRRSLRHFGEPTLFPSTPMDGGGCRGGSTRTRSQTESRSRSQIGRAHV